MNLFGKVSAPIALALVLSACAGDNPDNVPEYGQWENVRKLDSVSLDGRALPPEAFAQLFDQLDVTEECAANPCSSIGTGRNATSTGKFAAPAA